MRSPCRTRSFGASYGETARPWPPVKRNQKQVELLKYVSPSGWSNPGASLPFAVPHRGLRHPKEFRCVKYGYAARIGQLDAESRHPGAHFCHFRPVRAGLFCHILPSHVVQTHACFAVCFFAVCWRGEGGRYLQKGLVQSRLV